MLASKTWQGHHIPRTVQETGLSIILGRNSHPAPSSSLENSAHGSTACQKQDTKYQTNDVTD